MMWAMPTAREWWCDRCDVGERSELVVWRCFHCGQIGEQRAYASVWRDACCERISA